MIEETQTLWVCNVKFRAYQNPQEELEYHCFSRAGGTLFMKDKHKRAGCGVYERIAQRLTSNE